MGEGNCEQEYVPHNYEEEGQELRKEIKSATVIVSAYVTLSKEITIPENVNRGEMIANAILALRHLEDAAMRIGKCLQAFQGGVSILDKMKKEEFDEISKRRGR